ncbi:hypothetical protein BDZ89DRAFT_1153960 [Hymenopellis radicata]|nr:hypothetical protein BDZ89DRAFT_1153960 [Hymenopellis radicata]
MSLSVGGLGLISLRNPFADVVGTVWGKGDIRSMFWLIVFCIVFLVLAYLTNPSETSFRTFLTEQSFRQHLSRLDDNIDEHEQETNSSHRSSVRRNVPHNAHTLPFDNRSPFHFANRASVSLRTPKHVFHSFGIFTIAAIIPVSKSERGAVKSIENISVICDSWYLGVFGRWWRGGVLESWYQDVFSRANDEESWSSGILGMKTTERHNDYSGLPFSTKNLPPHLLSRGSPPRLRNRDKSSQRSGTTPTPQDHAAVSPPLIQPQSKSVYSESLGAGPQGHTLATFDQSPHVADLLRQVSTSKASILELHTQLNDCRLGASQSHAVLQQELESCRERKRQEDSVRNELKTRTKTLDDAKRQAESSKRDSDKRLKAAITTRQDTQLRIDHIDSDIARLRRCILADEEAIAGVESQAETQVKAALEQKHYEINAAEDAVAALNLRTRDLEDKLAAQKDKLQAIRERMQVLQQSQRLVIFSYRFSHGATSSDGASSDIPSPLLPEFASRQSAIGTLPSLSQPYTREHDRQLGQPVTSNFAPFADLDQQKTAALSPTSSSLIPSGLMSSLALDNVDGISRSFQSESDVFLDRHWRKEAAVYGPPHRQHSSSDEHISRYDTLQSSPTSLHAPGSDTEYDPFEVRMQPRERERYSLRSDAMDMQRASLYPRNPSIAPSSCIPDKHNKKGLNPDAQVFSVPRSRTSGHISQMSYDALNPHGMGHNLAAHTSDSSTLLRAFAPSAAEREVLQRALGGSTNASLERLPSLSDVGSIPPSPNHVHAQSLPGSTMDKIPAWLQSLPRIRKPNFSPWDEEDVAPRKSG